MHKTGKLLRSPALRELLVYGVVGVLTTLVNIVCFALLDGPVRASLGMDSQNAAYLTAANALANVLSIVFAFFANKIFVFRSRSWQCAQVCREAVQFAIARVLALFLDIGAVNLCVLRLGMVSMISKLLANVLVIVVNYITGKLWVFRRAGQKEEGK